jgi:hypothetical protein
MSLDGIRRARERIHALVTAQKKPSEEETRAAVADLLRDAADVPDDYAGSLQVSGFAFEAKPAGAAETAQPLRLSFAELTGTSDLRGLKREKGDIAATTGIEGLAMTGVPPPADGLVPSSASIEVHFDSLPMQALSKAFTDILVIAADSDRKKASEDVRAVITPIPGLLAASGASFTVRNTYVRSADLSATIDGKTTASARSPLGGEGSMTFALTGLDELIEKYRTLGASNPMTLHYTQGIVPLQLMGQMTRAADGRSVRTYKFDVTPEGKILLNGVDISVIRGLAAPATVTSPAPRAP